MSGASAARRERLAFLLLVLIQLLPVWLPHRLPMQDLPQHLAKLEVLTADDPALGLDRFYRVRWLPAPYVSFYAFGAALGRLVGIDAAARAWISLYVIAFPLAVRAWLAAARPGSERLAWLAPPLVFNPYYYLGFTNLLMGLPLFFAGLALACRDLAGRGGPGGRAAAAAVALLLYLTHPFVFLLFGFTLGLHLLAAGRGWRRAVRAGAFVLPATAAYLLWAARLAGEGTFAAPPREAAGVIWYPPWTTAGYLARFLPGPYASPGKDLAALAWLVAALLLVFVRPAAVPSGREALSRRGLAAVVAGVAALMFVLPFKFTYANYINLRPAPFLAALALSLVPAGRLARAGGRLIAAALTLALLSIACAYHLRFDREIRPLDTVLARMEPGRKVLPLVFDVEGEAFRGDWFLDMLIHTPAYYHAEKGGVGPYFQALTLFPVTLRPEVDLPAPSEYEAGKFRWAEHAAPYDYLLAFRPSPMVRGELLRHGRLLAADSGWMLIGKREALP